MCNVLHEQRDMGSRNFPKGTDKNKWFWFQIKTLLILNECIVGSLLIFQLKCLQVLNICYEENNLYFLQHTSMQCSFNRHHSFLQLEKLGLGK